MWLNPSAMRVRISVAIVYSGLIIAPIEVFNLRNAEFMRLACFSARPVSNNAVDFLMASTAVLIDATTTPATIPLIPSANAPITPLPARPLNPSAILVPFSDLPMPLAPSDILPVACDHPFLTSVAIL